MVPSLSLDGRQERRVPVKPRVGTSLDEPEYQHSQPDHVAQQEHEIPLHDRPVLTLIFSTAGSITRDAFTVLSRSDNFPALPALSPAMIRASSPSSPSLRASALASSLGTPLRHARPLSANRRPMSPP